jgi:hypothetical protein
LYSVGPGRLTDAYVTLFAASQVPLSVIVIGTLQPLALGRPNYDRWSVWALRAAAADVISVAAVGAFLVAFGYSAADVAPLAGLLAASGAVSCLVAVTAVHLAADARPMSLAAATFLPNACATAAVLAAPIAPVEMMCAALIAGNLVTWRIVRRKELTVRRDLNTVAMPEVKKETVGLLLSSGVGAAGPFALQAATATFPAGQATVLGFFSRIGAGLVGVGVTTFTNSVSDWRRESVRPLRTAAGIAIVAQTAIVACIVILLASGVRPGSAMAGLVAVAWVLAAAMQSCAGRALAMAGDLSAFRTMALLSAVLYVAGTYSLLNVAQSAFAYFLLLFAINSTAAFVFMRALRWRRESRSLMVSISVAAIGYFVISAIHG